MNGNYIITARKRSLGQDNNFTGACLSTGGGQSAPRRGSTSWIEPPPLDRDPPPLDRDPPSWMLKYWMVD